MDRYLNHPRTIARRLVALLMEFGCAKQPLLAAWLVFPIVMFDGSSAISQVVSQSVLPAPPERIVVDQNNVDISRGPLSFSKVELSIGDERYGLALRRFYNSRSGWRDNFSGLLDVHTYGLWNAESTITASWGNQTWVFDQGASTSRSGDGTLLTWLGPSGYEVTMRDGTVVTYSVLTPGYFTCAGDGNPCHDYYFPTNVAYPNGLIVKPNYRVFLGSGIWQVRLQSVTNNAGYQIKFTYQSNTISNSSSTWAPWMTRTSAKAINNAVEYCDPNADTCSLSGNWPTVSYSYAGLAHTVTDSLNRSTRYTYGSNSFLVKTPGSATDNIQYQIVSFLDESYPGQPPELVWHVTSATLGSNTWSYAYAQNSPTNPTVRTITSTDPQAKDTVFTSLDLEGWVPTSLKDPLNRTTTFNYPCGGSTGAGAHYFNSGSYSITSPEGNATVRACDSRGNVTSTTFQSKPGSGLANITMTAVFTSACPNPKTCNQPTATIDGRGAQTDYTYFPTHGGIETETMPSPLVGGTRPQKRYTYSQVYAYVRNASGALVQASSPVWMVTQISECHTSASCAGTADEIKTNFAYAASATSNALLVRGKVVTSGSTSLRTCYSYDSVGNRISVTTPRAVLSTCPL